MKYILLTVLASLAVQVSVAPPVNQNKEDREHSDENAIDDKHMAGIMEYQRYLTEVVETLESDPEFRAKLQNAANMDIHTGKIADELEFVNHKVRTRLDEIKREELERLRHLATKENHLMNGLDFDHLKVAEHLDHTNTRTFEIEDLKKLILKTTKDLAKGDQMRKEKFKEREMDKKFAEQQKLKSMDENERKKYEEELRAMKEKHKNHEPQVHHPGSKQQLEEVWEKQDHMENQDFNPKTFFFLHDVDGNGFWDQDEVKALFLKELDKLYAQGAPPDELMRRSEEMERMREHVFNEADLNKDGLISYEEFIEQTKKPDFEQDEGWEGLDEQQIYTPEEFEAFEKRRQEEIQKMIAKGMPPPHPGNVPVPHEPFPPQYANPPVIQGAAASHPQQYQSQHHESYQPQLVVVPQQQYQNQMPVQQMHGQVPQQEYHQQIPHHQMQAQMQQHQYQQAQTQQQQHYPDHMNQQQGQVPIPNQQYQVPAQQQQVPVHGQVPVQSAQVPAQQGQGQAQHGQVPVQQGQAPAQQQPQTVQHSSNQPNTINQIPQSNAGSQEHNENNLGRQPQQKQQAAQGQQAGMNRNNINTAGKV